MKVSLKILTSGKVPFIGTIDTFSTAGVTKNKYTFAYCLMFKWYIITNHTEQIHSYKNTIM